MAYKLDGTRFKAWTDSGAPLVAGLLYTYASGTTTNKATYTDATLGASNTNPIVLDARGEGDVWLGSGAYTFVLKTAAGVTIDTVDGVVDPQASVLADLASAASGKGAALVGVDVDNDYADGTLGFLVVKNTSTAYNALKGFTKTVQAQIQAGTYAGDVTATVNGMLTTERRVYLPYGTWPITALLVPSNRELFGDGGGMTTLYVISGSLTQAVKNSDVAGGNSRLHLHDFGIVGNTAGNATGSGVYLDNVNDSTVERLAVNDVVDWGIAILAGNRNHVLRNNVSAVKGINSAGGVRAGFLFGATGGGLKACNDIEVVGNYVTGVTEAYVDGFIFEYGTKGLSQGNWAIQVPYTGHKCSSFNELTRIGNHAVRCLVGFQSLVATQNLTDLANHAYRNSGAGFQYNQSDAANPARDWVIVGNRAIENGQNEYSALYGASGVRYGFAFEAGGGATIDGVLFSGNIAQDRQGVQTQGRGLSFGSSGTISNVTLGTNQLKGHVADVILGASLQTSTFVSSTNAAVTGDGRAVIPALDSEPVRFWTDNIPASAGVTLLSDGLSGRGMVMPKAGYLRGVYIKGSATPTAGSYTVYPRKNGADLGSGLTVTTGTFNSVEETPFSVTFAAGDVLTCRYSSNAGLLPAGSIDLDVTVEVVYQ